MQDMCLSDDPTLIVGAMLSAWADSDVERTLSWLSPDCTYSVSLTSPDPEDRRIVQGVDEIRASILRTFDLYATESYVPIISTNDGTHIHALVKFVVRHKDSGLSYDGTLRQVCVVEDGQVRSIVESHDVERTKAFLQLAAARVAEQRMNLFAD